MQSSTFGSPMAPTTGFSFGTSTNPSNLASAGTLFSTAGLSAVNSAAPTMAGGGTGGLFGNMSTIAPTATGSTFGGLGSGGGFGMSTQPTAMGLTFNQPGGFGGGLTGVATTGSSGGLGLFGSSIPTTATSLFGSAAQTLTTQSMGLGGGGGFFGTSNLTAPNQLLTGTSTTAPAITGLGGVGVSQTSTGGPNQAKNDSLTVKELPVPQEIMTITEDFKKYMKEQKAVREEISRASGSQLMKVREEIANQKQLLSVVSNGIQRNLAAITILKQETVQELKHAEIMQRTKDIPLGLQYENSGPTEYFRYLIGEFETKMQKYRQQIGMMERHLELVTHSSVLTSQDLTLTLKKFHDTLIFLAAELHTLNEKIAAQKDHFMMYRRLVHQDSSNIFASATKTSANVQRSSSVAVTLGPNPFTGSRSITTMALASALEKVQQPSALLGFGGNSMFGSSQFQSGSSLGGSTSLFPLESQGK